MSILNFKKLFKKYRNHPNDININELNEIISIKSDVILLDVRSLKELNEGHLNGAINIPLYELEMCCDCKLKDKYKTIIVYCQSGIRSKKAIKILYRNGFTNLYNLKGGLDNI